jgi:hypothetical protein
MIDPGLQMYESLTKDQNAESLIRESLNFCRNNEINIKPGARFSFNSDYQIEEVNCFGAVYVALKLNFVENPITNKYFCEKILKKNEYWAWHFGYGFNQGRIISVYIEDSGNRKYTDDKISSAGLKLAKEFDLWKNS